MVKIITFGCRLNSFESQVLKEKLADYDDNLIVINSCAVTQEAQRQCKQEIRKIRKLYPNSKIVLTGCAAQTDPQTFSDMKELDLVLGNAEKQHIEQYLNSTQKNHVGNIFDLKACDCHTITGFEGRHKAFVQIQQGCSHRCTYCIVPYARGNNRSVNEQDIINQIQTLVNAGFKHICLTGVDICSYKPSFSELVGNILDKVPNLDILSFGSLDPAYINEDFIIKYANHPRIYPYMHFSVQSGDNLILKKMGRRHNREHVIKICNLFKQQNPDIVLGADFICGFPTETAENFQNTVKLVQEAKLTRLHVFPYSQRNGTPAAKMEQIPVNIRKERAAVLRSKGEECNV